MQTQLNSIFSRFYRVSAKVNMVLTPPLDRRPWVLGRGPVLHEILIGSMLSIKWFDYIN